MSTSLAKMQGFRNYLRKKRCNTNRNWFPKFNQFWRIIDVKSSLKLTVGNVSRLSASRLKLTFLFVWTTAVLIRRHHDVSVQDTGTTACSVSLPSTISSFIGDVPYQCKLAHTGSIIIDIVSVIHINDRPSCQDKRDRLSHMIVVVKSI